jgi:hypothetical protein
MTPLELESTYVAATISLPRHCSWRLLITIVPVRSFRDTARQQPIAYISIFPPGGPPISIEEHGTSHITGSDDVAIGRQLE